MTLSPPITEDDIEDYIADRLGHDRRRAVDQFLLADPQRREEVEALIVQQDALRQMGADLLEEPVPQRFLKLLMDEPDETGIETAASAAPKSRAGSDQGTEGGG